MVDLARGASGLSFLVRRLCSHASIPTIGITPFDWRATAVLPIDEAWLIYRHANLNDDRGWIEGARALAADAAFEETAENWGTQIIRRAVGGDISGINTTTTWYAAKVNIHLHRQIRLAQENITGFEGDDDDGDRAPRALKCIFVCISICAGVIAWRIQSTNEEWRLPLQPRDRLCASKI